MTTLDDQVEVRDGRSGEVLWSGRLGDVDDATNAAVPPPEPEPEPEPEPKRSRLDELMASERRRTFDLERDTGVTPSLSAEDAAFVRDLKDAPGGFDPNGTWLLPSGLPLFGREVAELDEP